MIDIIWYLGYGALAVVAYFALSLIIGDLRGIK